MPLISDEMRIRYVSMMMRYTNRQLLPLPLPSMTMPPSQWPPESSIFTALPNGQPTESSAEGELLVH